MPRTFGTTNLAPYSAAPAVGPAGDAYYNTAEKVLYLSDGTAWNSSTTAVSAGSANYKWNTSTAAADPGTGRMASNNAAAASVTALYLSVYDQSGSVIRLDAINTGDGFVIYQTGALNSSVRYTVSATPTNNANTWFTIPVTWQATGSAGFVPGNNASVQIQATAAPGGSTDEVVVAGGAEPTSLALDLWVDLDGVASAAGQVPSGGAALQALFKNTSTDFDTGWQNAPPIFASTAARDAAWPSPPNGAMCTTTDTGALWQRISGVWYKPNSLLARAVLSTDVNGIGTGGATLITTGTVYIPSGRWIQILGHLNMNGLANGCYMWGRVDASAYLGHRLAQFNGAASSSGFLLHGSAMTNTPTYVAVGNHTFSIGVNALSGTINTVTTADPGYIEVYDMGAV